MRLFRSLLLSARPHTWFRIWGEMIMPAAMAAFLGGRAAPVAFLLAFLATSPLLWTAGYLLNDYTDWALDRQHAMRSQRPLARGTLAPSEALVAMGLAAALALGVGWLLGTRVFGCLLLLGASQSLYSLKPFRWKERPGLDLASNTLNSVLRSAIAWHSQTDAPLGRIGFLVAALALAKLALFLGHRYQNRSFEQEQRLRSTVTLLPQWSLLVMIGATAGLALALLGGAALAGRLPWMALGAALAGGLPLLAYLVVFGRRAAILEQERSSGFRSALYVTLFLMGNLGALPLLLRPRPSRVTMNVGMNRCVLASGPSWRVAPWPH